MARRLLLVLAAFAALPARADDPTTEQELEPTGSGMYGDRCSTTADCGFPGAVCASPDKRCTCHPNHPATNHIDKCGSAVGVNESCIFNEQCQEQVEKTECRSGRCACLYEMIAELDASGTTVCVPRNDPVESTTHFDPAMIGVLVGMALMFVIICVVLRLFSRARWRENRTIFNTPNPRLMNVSLLKDSKLLHAQDGRRGSRASMRAPSRQASQQELRAHSPQGKVKGSRRGSRASSNVSAASSRSSKSPTGHTQTNHSSTVPMLESVTIEVQEPKA